MMGGRRAEDENGQLGGNLRREKDTVDRKSALAICHIRSGGMA